MLTSEDVLELEGKDNNDDMYSFALLAMKKSPLQQIKAISTLMRFVQMA